jgi:hypothetical protein
MITIDADVSATLRDFAHLGEKVPEAIVRGIAQTAKRGCENVRQRTRHVFKLHSDYIPRSIRYFPDLERVKAIAAATKGLVGQHHDFQAAVYLKGSNDPRKSLAYLVDHETGARRKPISGQNISLPGRDVQKRSFRTNRGAVRKSWKPAKLLEYFNLTRGKRQRGKQKVPSRGKPKAFILETPRGRFIVRRQSRRNPNLEFLYRFIESVQIDKRWGFVDTVRKTVSRHLSKNVAAELNRIK